MTQTSEQQIMAKISQIESILAVDYRKCHALNAVVESHLEAIKKAVIEFEEYE